MPITGRTAVLAIIADPVVQARAPVLVNATSLGMQTGDGLPLDVAGLQPGMVAAEVVIQPGPTPFLVAAAEHGCAVHPGEPMLAAQIELMIDFMET